MNILLLTNYFLPEIAAPANLYYYLGKEFVNNGHRVTVITGMPRYNVSRELYKEYFKKTIEEDFEGMRIIRVRVPYIERKRTLRRGLEHFEIARKFFKIGKKYLKKVDVALVCTPPLTLYKTIDKLSREFDFPYILGIQDIFPQNAVDLGIMKNKLLIKFFENMEKKAYKKAYLITLQSKGHIQTIRNKIGNDDKIVIMQNWIDSNKITPGEKNNQLCKDLNITDKFVVSYAGTYGHSQNFDIIFNAAKQTKDFPITYLLAGGGLQEKYIEKQIERLSLKNVIKIPLQKGDNYKLLLNLSDISLVTLKKEVKTPTVPSKIINSMSAGVPILSSMNIYGDAPKLISEAKAGINVDPDDEKKFVEEIINLYNDNQKRTGYGRNGRKYVEENLSVNIAVKKFEKIFVDLISDRRKTCSKIKCC